MSISRVCTSEGCDTITEARGMCKNHYNKWYKTQHGSKSYRPKGRLFWSRHYRTVQESDWPLVDIWINMHNRCKSPNPKIAEVYAQRKITVCDRWSGEEGLANFIKDMGAKPGKVWQLDRIDNQEGYSPLNCRWATRQTQMVNRRMFKNNTTGYKNIYRNHSSYKVIVKRNCRVVCDKSFPTLSEAKNFRDKLLATLDYKILFTE